MHSSSIKFVLFYFCTSLIILLPSYIFSLIDLSFIVLQVVEQIGLVLHVKLYVPRQKNTAEEWCCVVQNLAATVLLA